MGIFFSDDEIRNFEQIYVIACGSASYIGVNAQYVFEDLVKETPGIELVFSPCGGHDGETVVGVKKTGCQGFCELGPLVRIQKGDKVIQYVKVQPEDCAEIVEKSILGDEVIACSTRRAKRSTFSPMKFPSSRSRPGSFWKTAASSTPNLWTSIWPPAALTR